MAISKKESTNLEKLKVIEILNDFDRQQIINISNENLLDFSKIKNKDYIEEISKNGFLIAPHILEDLKKDGDILLGIKEGDQVIAYIWASPTDGINKEYTWSNPQIKEKIFGKKNYYLNQIGVSKSHQHQGLGGKLINSLPLWFTDKTRKYIVASIAYGPIKNQASIGFNQKHGFEQVAISPIVKFHQFENYQSLLFAKKIN